MSATNDSLDLENLFDSILDANKAIDQKKADAPTNDSDELQDLFDVICEEKSVKVTASAEWGSQEVVFNKVGQMARALHDTLGQLGFEGVIKNTVAALPDAKDRLAYVANITEQAACKVLNAVDVLSPIVDSIQQISDNLGNQWDLVYEGRISPTEFQQLAKETRAFFKSGLTEKTSLIHNQLTEIMMAQDFQDLTGQVIKKIVALAQELENGLMSVLLETVPETKKTDEVTNLMNGPVINAEGRSDVVVNQEQVDDLLESLGF